MCSNAVTSSGGDSPDSGRLAAARLLGRSLLACNEMSCVSGEGLRAARGEGLTSSFVQLAVRPPPHLICRAGAPKTDDNVQLKAQQSTSDRLHEKSAGGAPSVPGPGRIFLWALASASVLFAASSVGVGHSLCVVCRRSRCAQPPGSPHAPLWRRSAVASSQTCTIGVQHSANPAGAGSGEASPAAAMMGAWRAGWPLGLVHTATHGSSDSPLEWWRQQRAWSPHGPHPACSHAPCSAVLMLQATCRAALRSISSAS